MNTDHAIAILEKLGALREFNYPAGAKAGALIGHAKVHHPGTAPALLHASGETREAAVTALFEMATGADAVVQVGQTDWGLDDEEGKSGFFRFNPTSKNWDKAPNPLG